MDQENQKHILIVEDDPSAMKALIERLKDEADFVLAEAQDGQAGLEMALRDHPDLVLLDIILPSVDGMTILRKLREDAWGKTVPIVILTNLQTKESIEEAEIAGVPHYLVKTEWTLDEVVGKMREALRDGQSAARESSKA